MEILLIALLHIWMIFLGQTFVSLLLIQIQSDLIRRGNFFIGECQRKPVDLKIWTFADLKIHHWIHFGLD